MAMFLTILFSALLVLAFNAIVLAGIKNEEKRRSVERAKARVGLEPSAFFDRAAAKPVVPGPIPIEVVLSQIESDVRQEQAAAETFLAGPTKESLHSRPNPSTLN